MELVRGDARFTTNSRRVIHEEVDGEVIVIQLEDGNYYSLTGIGAEAWPLLVAGRSPAEAAAALTSDTESAAQQLRELTSELVAEHLLEPLPAGDEPAAAAPASPDPPKPAFQPPRLEKFSDMQDYLLIDPIHEVDEPGWPAKRDA